MRSNLLSPLGSALRQRRQERGLTQPQLAARLGRSAPRISELETELLADRLGKDRLSLLVQICDALDLTPILVPREQAQAIARQLGRAVAAPSAGAGGRVFDEVFVDLADDEEESR